VIRQEMTLQLASLNRSHAVTAPDDLGEIAQLRTCRCGRRYKEKQKRKKERVKAPSVENH